MISPPVLTARDELCEKAIRLFQDKFGESPQAVACGPGRVCLIGDHIDYNQGFVFPAALDRKTVVALTLNDTGKYHMVTDDLRKEVCWNGAPPTEPEEKADWYSYILGTIRLFIKMSKLNFPSGFNLLCITTVPIGSGLSSSAALNVATATAMEAATGNTLDVFVKARDVCQDAEHQWAKVPCGLMDPAISIMGQEGHAMLFDCRNQIATQVPIPEGTSIIVVNSGVLHSLMSSEFTNRTVSCENAARVVKKLYPEVIALRDVTPNMLEESRENFSDPVDFKRATHVVYENLRIMAFADALKSGDLKGAGKIMLETHASLRENYEITVPETDAIVSIASNIDGVWGCKMTGGGFGGSVCILVQSEKAEAVAKSVLEKYLVVFNKLKKAADEDEGVYRHSPSVFIAKASRGATAYCPTFYRQTILAEKS